MDDVPRVEWDAFRTGLRWRQGEHVALIGPTGKGKTTLALSLLPLRAWSVILATKPRDATLAGLERRHGYVRTSAWPPPALARRVLLWPPYKSPADERRQAVAIHDALLGVFTVGGWCVLADDVQYLARHLGLARVLAALWIQARAMDVSLVAATQRPRHVPLEMWSQSSHLFLWRCTDDDDLRRIGGLGSADTATVRRTVAGLEDFDALYVDARSGALAITRAPARPVPPTR